MDSNQDFGSILNSSSGSSPTASKQDSNGFGSLLNGYEQVRTSPTRTVNNEAVGTTVDEFVKSVAPAAQKVAQRLNVPVEAVIGQWGVETGWGKSVIPGTNNLGNVKDKSGKGTAATDNATGSRDNYRQYASVDEFADDFANLVGNGRYKAVAGSPDAQTYFNNLKAGGYAEDPAYAQKGAAAAKMAAEALTRNGGASPDYGNRADGSKKGKGFLGELRRPDGDVSTEISIGVNIGGKETDIPSLVPTLTKQEVDHLLSGGAPTEAIVQKAVAHAKQRIASGKSPFASEGEQTSTQTADLSKAPKWADVEGKPEFKALSPEKQAETKAAYFDYWIAPRAGDKAEGLRQQFLAKTETGFVDKAVGVAKDIGGAIVDAVTPAKSVMEGKNIPAAPDLPTTSRVPVKPEVRAAFNAQWDAATPEQRAAMSEREDWVGMLAKERAGVFERQDATGLKSMQAVDPRIESRVSALVANGEDPRFAERAAREAAAAGVPPGREIEFMQKNGGLAQKSNFDFDTKQLFDQQGGTNGLNNPLARGLAKGALGLGKAATGYGEFLADTMGLDHASKTMREGGDSLRGKEQAIGESGSFMERNFEGAVNSIAQQLPLLITGTKLESEAVPLAGIGMQTFGQEYSDGRAQGQSIGEASTRASIFAAFEIIGEKFGLKENMQAIKAAARGMPSDQIIGFLWSALKKEVPGEVLTTTGQFATDKLPGGIGLNQNATGADYLKQVADTIAQTIMQTGLMAGGTTGVSKAVQYARDKGPLQGVAEADAELAKQQALNKWNTNGLNSRIEPTVSSVPDVASVTPDGRVEPTLNPEAATTVTPDEPAGAPAIHPTTQVADNIVRELATNAGIPHETVLPAPAPQQTTGPESVSDQDVLDFADSRFQQLREKRNGKIETVVGETGIVDQDMPGAGLSAAEQQELDNLQRAGNDPKALRQMYGFDQTIPSDQSQLANQAQVPAPATGPVEQPTAGQQFPATTEPGLLASQQGNSNVETQQQGQATGPALNQDASIAVGQPSGPAAVQEPTAQAPAAQNDVGNAVGNTGQQDNAVQTSSALTEPARQGQFASAIEAKKYISDQRRASSAKLPRALPLPYSDGTFGIATEKSEGWAGALAYDKANAPKTEKQAKERRNGNQADQAQQAKAQQQEAPPAAAVNEPNQNTGTQGEATADQAPSATGTDATAGEATGVSGTGSQPAVEAVGVEKPKTEKESKAKKAQAPAAEDSTPKQPRIFEVFDTLQVETKNGPVDVSISYAFNPEKYRSIYGVDGAILNFNISGKGVVEGMRGVNGLTYQGPTDKAGLRQAATDYVELQAASAKPPKKAKPKTEKEAKERKTVVKKQQPDVSKTAPENDTSAKRVDANSTPEQIGAEMDRLRQITRDLHAAQLNMERDSDERAQTIEAMDAAENRIHEMRNMLPDEEGAQAAEDQATQDDEPFEPNPNWRESMYYAREYARELGLDPDGKELAALVAAIDAKLKPAVSPKPKTEKEAKAKRQQKAAPKVEKNATSEQKSSITDFGEKIGGAKKDVWTGFKDKLTEVSDDQIAAKKLSEVWPAPDYQALIDGGMDKEAVAIIRTMRDEIPAKPRAPYKVKRWAEQVKTLRQFASSIMDGSTTPQRVREEVSKGGDRLKAMMGRADLYMEVGHSKSLEGIRLAHHFYTLYKGEKNVSKWVVERDSAATSFSNWPQELAVAETKEDAIAAFKAKYDTLDSQAAVKKASFDIISSRGSDGYWVAKKIGRNYAKLSGPFATVKEARDYRTNNIAELEAKLEKYKEIPRERRDVNEPRVGEDMRNGQDVTPEMFAQTFGFRGVEFGNWVEQKRRQKDLNDAFDGLMDMAAILGIPAKAISLNGSLGLAFGARGSGGKNPAAAHYESGSVVINLTKMNGAGSLGHEWWHALDNYFANQRKAGGFMTTASDVSLAARGSNYYAKEGVRKEMIEAFGQVLKSINQTAMKKRSANLDAKRTKEYWGTGEELSARAFEAYLISKLQDQEASNDYLANIVDEQTWNAAALLGMENENSYPYPTEGELPSIRAGFDQFFQTIEHEETDNGVRLFNSSRTGSSMPMQLSLDAVKKSVESALKRVPNAPSIEVARRPEAVGITPPAGVIPKGVTLDDGSIIVFSDAAESVLDVFQTVFHELFHRGSKVRFTNNTDYINAMLEIAANDETVRALVKEWKEIPDGQDKLQQFKDKGPMTGNRLANYEAIAVEESLATIAQKFADNPQEAKPLLKRITDFLAKVAQRWGMDRLAQWLKNEKRSKTEQFVLDTIGMSGGQPNKFSTALLFNAKGDSTDPQNVTRRVQNNLIQFFGNREEKSLKTFGLYDKTLSTQYNKALKDKHFGKVFGYVNAMQNEVSLTSIRPAELAPGVLPRVDDVKSSVKQLVKGKETSAHLNMASKAIFDGTLDGDSVTQGKVWSRDEFMARYGATETGWALYKQARAAIDASLDEVAAAEAYAMAQGFIPKAMRRQIIDNPQKADRMIGDVISKQIKLLDIAIKKAKTLGAEEQQADLERARASYLNIQTNIEKIFVTAKNLKQAGYAPLMRFGKFTVTVQPIDSNGNVLRDENGESITEFFGQYETEGEAKSVRAQMEGKYKGRDDMRVKAGTKSQSGHELYSGISPETLALFAEAIGADAAMRKHIELAMTERSALKRRLHRKGTEGYSEDLPRVLSQFITSNGRHAAQRYYLRDLNNAIKYIPKEKGDVLDEAIRLKAFVLNPNDPAAPFSSIMFAWFLGGSVASAMVNLTQPIMMTAPYLSQFGISTATKSMATAMPYAMGRKQITDTALREALKRASQEGIVDAQEIFHLYSVGAQGVASGLVKQLARLPGVGTKIKAGSEDARARINAFLTLWGSMFAVAEGFNRKLTFIAAWEVAKANSEKNPYAFAVRSVNETQGIYNKVNRPNWAQNPWGRTLLTFKQYSIMYVELLVRMWKHGGPEGKRAALIMLGVLMLAAGEEGLPFAQDLDDLIDTIGQGFFKSDTNMKRNKRRVAHEILGKQLGDLFLYGVSSYLPLDFAGRIGLGNLAPGTALFKPSDADIRGRQAAELLGPTAGMAMQIGDAYDAVVEGNTGKSVQNLAPKAVKDLLAAGEMAKKGYATDAKGRKVVDVGLGDAAIKGIGFQPTKVAEETRKTMPVYQDIALQKKTESSIVGQWSRGITDNDPEMIREAIQRRDDWNKRNPDSRIDITQDQVRNRVRQALTEKDNRLLKQAPREMRGRVGLDLAK